MNIAMSNLRANIRNNVNVADDLRVKINTIYPLEAFVCSLDGYLWVELYDMTDQEFDDAKLIGSSGIFGDTYAGTGYDAASIREKVAALVEQSQFYKS